MWLNIDESRNSREGQRVTIPVHDPWARVVSLEPDRYIGASTTDADDIATRGVDVIVR